MTSCSEVWIRSAVSASPAAHASILRLITSCQYQTTGRPSPPDGRRTHWSCRLPSPLMISMGTRPATVRVTCGARSMAATAPSRPRTRSGRGSERNRRRNASIGGIVQPWAWAIRRVRRHTAVASGRSSRSQSVTKCSHSTSAPALDQVCPGRPERTASSRAAAWSSVATCLIRRRQPDTALNETPTSEAACASASARVWPAANRASARRTAASRWSARPRSSSDDRSHAVCAIGAGKESGVLQGGCKGVAVVVKEACNESAAPLANVKGLARACVMPAPRPACPVVPGESRSPAHRRSPPCGHRRLPPATQPARPTAWQRPAPAQSRARPLRSHRSE